MRTQTGTATRQVVRRKGRRAGTPTLLPGAKISWFLRLLGHKGAAALLGAGLAALVAFPAVAAEDPGEVEEATRTRTRDPAMSFEAPTPAPGAELTGPQTVVVKAQADEFTVLKGFKLSVVSDDPSIPPFTHEVAPASFDGTKDQMIRFEWDTSRLTPHNGTYKLVAWGRSCDFDDCSFDASENVVNVTGLKVNNAPAAPQGVKAELQGANPMISWSPAGEPDVKRYQVMRSAPGQGAQLVGTTTATTFSDPCRDPLPCPGGTTLSYQVLAVRRSPVTPEGIVSAASAGSSLVAAAPAPVQGPAPAGQTKTGARAVAPAPAPRASAPVPASTADTTYAPTLPYPELTDPATVPPAPEPEPAPAAAQPVAGDAAATAAKLPARLEQPRIPKVRYIAGTLMLLVLAMHIARGGGLLLGGGSGERRR